MSIQQNINQLATVGAALYTQTPQFEELKQKKVEKGLEKEVNVNAALFVAVPLTVIVPSPLLVNVTPLIVCVAGYLLLSNS